MRFVLAGMPNAGKSTLFNALAAARQRTANYPGVTMQTVEADIVDSSYRVVDLPGVYSLLGEDDEQTLVRQYLETLTASDILAVVVDLAQFAEQLPIVLELQQAGYKPWVVLTGSDKIEARAVDDIALSELLGVQVVKVSAYSPSRVRLLVSMLNERTDRSSAIALTEQGTAVPTSSQPQQYLQYVDKAHDIVAKVVRDDVSDDMTRDQANRAAWTAKIDGVVLHPLWGLLCILGVLYFSFQLIFNLSDIPNVYIAEIFEQLNDSVKATWAAPDNFFYGLTVDAIIPGLGTVLSFLPNILLFSLFILILESCGYIARLSYLFDQILGRTALGGYSLFPLLSGLSCALLAVSSTRSIPDKRARVLTMAVIPLIPCTARLPAYSVLIAAFIPSTSLGVLGDLRGVVLFAIYIFGIASALVVARLLSAMVKRDESAVPFILELPHYRLPKLRDTGLRLWMRTRAYVYRAGTIILIGTCLIWLMTSWQVAGEGLENSVAGIMGQGLLVFFAPLGFDLEMTIAMVPGMLAREVVVSSLASMYGIHDQAEAALSTLLATRWTIPTALGFLTWTIYAPQCISTFAIIKAESNSYAVTSYIFLGLLAFAYLMALLVYQFALLFWP